MTEEMNAEKGSDRKDDRINHIPRRILVVDDEPCVLDLFPFMFPSPNYLVAVAADGRKALQLAETQVFDLAIVDCILPGEKCAVAAIKLRKLQPNMKIVLMSGYYISDRTAVMKLAGAKAFLVKPFLVEHAQRIAAILLREAKPTLMTSMDGDGVSSHRQEGVSAALLQ
ncbi:MAG: response regulator [Verrucomicrobiia bacterium]|jgi:CheY-like chemotaxis protein